MFCLKLLNVKPLIMALLIKEIKMVTLSNKIVFIFCVKIFLFFQFITAQESYLLDNFVEIKKDTLGKTHHFFISKYAVTIKDYKNYLTKVGLQLPELQNHDWLQTNLPIVGVSYDDFIKYCDWLSNKFKINFKAPTDLEWTIAAANQENPMQKLYASQPVEVDFIRPNKYGISGMNGNVWEWTSTLKDNEYNIIRGGSYMESMHPDTLNVNKSSAIHASLKLTDVGFRLAIDASEMHKYLFAKKVETILKTLYPEYTNLGVDAKAMYINDGFINWDTSKNILIVNEKEKFIQFDGITYQKKSDNQFTISEKYYFDIKDIEKVKELKDLINTERKSTF